MQAKDRHLIAIDLDDTVLGELFSLNVKSVWTLIEAQEAGHIVMIASARPTSICLPFYRSIGLHSMMSVLNGTYMYHPDDASCPRFNHELKEETVAEILNAAKEIKMEKAWLQADDLIISQEPTYPGHRYFKQMFRMSEWKIEKELPVIPCARIHGWAPTEEQFLEMKNRFENHPEVRIVGGPARDGDGFNIYLWSATADKWYTVQEAAKYYGIHEQNILAFGDENNDRMMLMNAPHGFVMCNGNKQLIEDMRAAGKNVTTYPCMEGGVGYEVAKLLGL